MDTGMIGTLTTLVVGVLVLWQVVIPDLRDHMTWPTPG